MEVGPKFVKILYSSALVLFVWLTGLLDVTTPPAFPFYGDIQMNRTAKQYGFPPAIFPHWAHRIQFTCQVCHPAIFRMEAGAHEIMMEKMSARGKFCAACHNGKIAWKPVNCTRCHLGDGKPPRTRDPGPSTLPTPGPPFSKENGDPEVRLKTLPRDPSGNIDWIEALTRGLISPRSSLKPRRPERVPIPPDTRMSRTETLPAVIFPHSSHARWLDCGNCHPDPFVPRKGANQISMAKIWAGTYCGKCHGKVAFPVTQCDRCHRGSSSPTSSHGSTTGVANLPWGAHE